MATYYIDGTTLSNSTSVYDDAAQTILASDGWYSDGVVSRELVSGVLLPILTCPGCDPPCGVTGAIASNSLNGLFKLNTSVGETTSDVGAIKVTFIPNLQGSGIRATFNGNVYNQLSSELDGFHSSDTAGNYTIVGNTGASGCFILPINTNYTQYNYVSGAFVDSGLTQNVQLSTGDLSVSGSGGTTTKLIMVIPKLTAAPSTVSFDIATPCSSTDWTIEIDCPILLTAFGATLLAYTTASAAAGIAVFDAMYYNIPVNVTSTVGEPQLHDWVFTDAYGQNLLADGYYGINTSAYPTPAYMLVANGVITDISTFP